MTDRHRPIDPDSPQFQEALGRTIRLLRIDQRKERKDLADESGISYSYLSAIETGQKSPSRKVLHLIARTLGLTEAGLLAMARERIASESGQVPMAAAPPPESSAAPRRWFHDEPVHVQYRAMAAPSHQIPEAESSRRRFDAGMAMNRRRATDEINALLDDMDDDDALALLDMARRIARGSDRRRDR